jgi:exosortase/archaeosortase family protein
LNRNLVYLPVLFAALWFLFSIGIPMKDLSLMRRDLFACAVQITIAFGLGTQVLTKSLNTEFKWRPNGILCFAATVAAHCYCAYMRMPAWWLITVPLMFVSSAGTLVPLSTLARKAIELPHVVVFGSIASVTYLLYSFFAQSIWLQIMPATGKTVFWVLKPFVSDLKMKIGNFSAVLESSFISVLIFFPCSGLECVAFLLFGLCILMMNDWKEIGWKGLAWFPIGICFALALNIVRIFLFLLFAQKLAENSATQDETTEYIRWLFHEHVGWVIYLLGIGTFLGFITWLHRPVPTLTTKTA